jgi:hypothetical protein
MFVAGLPIRDEAVLELARLVDSPELAAKLEDAYRLEVTVLAQLQRTRLHPLRPRGMEARRGALG